MNVTTTAQQANTSHTHASRLRQALLIDAVVSGATGLLLAMGGGVLGPLFNLPAALLTWSGLVLLPYVAVLYLLAGRARPPLGAVRAVIAANVAWVAASILLLVSGWVAPNLLGTAFVLVQAVVVAGFAVLQTMAVRE